MFHVVVAQDRFVVLAAVEDTDDGHHLGIHTEGDDRPLLIVCNAQARPNVIALGPAKGKRAQAFTVAYDGLGVLRRYIGRCGLRDVVVKLGKLFQGFPG